MTRAIFVLAMLIAPGAAALEPVPRPVLDGVEESVAGSITAHQEALAELIAQGAPAEQLAEAFGTLGMIYHAHQMSAAAEPCYANAVELAPGQSRFVYYLALLHLESGRFEASMAGFGRYLERHPDDAAALLRHGEAALELGRPDDADFERALKGETAAAARAGLGRAAMQAGRYSDAIRHFEAALVEQPSASRLHYHLAQAYRRLGRREEAARHAALYGRAETVFPEPLVAELRAMASGFYFHLAAGDGALADGRYGLARALYEEALAIDPESPKAHRGLGSAHQQLGQLDEARHHYGEAVRRQPANARYRFYLARVASALGDKSAAARELEESLRLDPGNAAARVNLGVVLTGLGAAERAEAQLRAALEAESEPRVRALAYYNVGVAELRRGELEAAAADLAEAVRHDPELAEARFHLANLEARQGRYGVAARLYAELLRRRPRHLGARLAEATALVLDGRHAAARRRLEEGIAIMPEAPILKHTLARIPASSPPPEKK